MSDLSQAALVELSRWVDAGNRERFEGMSRDELVDELLLLHRTIKAVEEVGELIGALIGVTGANPRKGVTHQRADVIKEGNDVAVSVLGAIEHITAHDGYALERLDSHIVAVAERAGVIRRSQ